VNDANDGRNEAPQLLIPRRVLRAAAIPATEQRCAFERCGPLSPFLQVHASTISGKISGRRFFGALPLMTNDLDLVNWTMREARQLRPEHHMHSEIEGPSSLNDVLQGVLEGERGEAKPEGGGVRSINFQSVQVTSGSPITRPPSEVSEIPDPDASYDLPSHTEAAPFAPSADLPDVPMSPLLKAVVEPDIYTAPGDRERAIALRWVLRDIKANRLKLSPVDQQDLRDLIDMGLVEMRNDAPMLTVPA
jgi:hypothetical protein